jgi:hypothetical protein
MTVGRDECGMTRGECDVTKVMDMA